MKLHTAKLRLGLTTLLAAAAIAHADPVEVDIQGFSFRPRNLTVEAGTTVRWTNRDGIEHTVTSQTGPGTLIPSGYFDSGFMSTDDAFEFTFDTPGTFYYWCVPHGSSMQGTVTVTETCLVDLNDDGFVDFSDYLEFLNLFDAADPRVDFTGDGLVDFSDYLEFLNLYAEGC